MHPILFKLGNLTIYSYGAMLALAAGVGLFLAGKEAARRGIEKRRIESLCLYILITGLLGARAYYVLFNLDYYSTHLLEIVLLRQGGLAIHGGILGGLLALFFFSRKWKLSFWKFADTLAPSLILGQALGRVGCLLNGCCYGTPTSLPWGISFPPEHLQRLGYFTYAGEPLHPTQIYSFLLNLGIFLFIYHRRKFENYSGALFLKYVLLYSAGRFLVEIFRGDTLTLGNTHFKAAQVMGVISVILAFLLMNYLRKKNV